MKGLEGLPTFRIEGTIAPKGISDIVGKSTSASDVVTFLDSYKDAPHIVIEISSDGGSVSEGKEIYNRLKQSGKKITTVTYRANSIATLIMLTGQKRYIVESGDFMIHAARVYGEDMPVGPLLAEDLEQIAREIKSSTAEVLDLYCKILGEDKRMALVAAMGRDEKLGAREAVKLGFANGYYRNSAAVESSTRSVLITNHLKDIIENQDNMKDNSAIVSLLKEIQMGLSKLMGGKTKMQVVIKTVDGVGIYFESANPDDPNDLAKAVVYKIDDTGAPTTEKLEDGEYALEDGRTIKVTGGLVESVTPTPVEENKDETKEQLAAKEAENVALKAQVEELNAKLSEKDAAVTAQAKEIQTINAKFTTLEKQFKMFMEEVPGDPKKKDEHKPKDFTKMNQREKAFEYARERRESMKK